MPDPLVYFDPDQPLFDEDEPARVGSLDEVTKWPRRKPPISEEEFISRLPAHLREQYREDLALQRREIAAKPDGGGPDKT
jgi:hypothetical protein